MWERQKLLQLTPSPTYPESKRTMRSRRPRARTSAPSSRPAPRSAPRRLWLALAGARAGWRARARPARAPTWGPSFGALVAGDLLLDQLLDEPRELGVEEFRHTLLVAADAPSELGRLRVTDLLSQSLEPRVEGDLDVLLAELLLGVAEVRLWLARDERSRRTDLTLDPGDGLAGCLADRLRNRSLRGDGHGRRLAAQLSDPPSDRALVFAGLRPMLLEALLVRHLLGELDVCREIGLELGLLHVRLVQPLDDLRIAFVHGMPPWRGVRSPLPEFAALTRGPASAPFGGRCPLAVLDALG